MIKILVAAKFHTTWPTHIKEFLHTQYSLGVPSFVKDSVTGDLLSFMFAWCSMFSSGVFSFLYKDWFCMKDSKLLLQSLEFARGESHRLAAVHFELDSHTAVSLTTVTLRKSLCLLNHMRNGTVIPKHVNSQKRCSRNNLADETPSIDRTASILGLYPLTETSKHSQK